MGKKEKAVAGEKKGGGGGGEDAKRDQKLQAILLADSFSKSFRPITWEKPKVLLPLVNVPMIEYTIEFLALNGVEEVQNVIIFQHTHQMHIGF
jgi:translation initiation factor eIF-2B subunit epsilon